jgi:hypothetical protein
MKSLTILLLVVVVAASCGQPKPRCFASIGSFAATYALREGTGPCSELPGDVLGVGAYNPRDESDPALRPDLDVATVAIGARRLGELADRAASEGLADGAPDHHRDATGTFSSLEPDDDGLCAVTDTAPARQTFPELPAIPADAEEETDAEPAVPPTDVTYSWSDLEFYVRAGASGQQLRGTLAYEENGCTATYDVRAVFPAVDCTGEDADGNPVPDDRWCDPEPSAFNGGVGSGLQFPTVCDETLLLCVLDADADVFPVLE